MGADGVSSPPATGEGEAFKRADASSFDAGAETYDRLTQLATGPLTAHLLDLARLRGDDSLLDLGTGTGIVPLYAAARPGWRGHVTALDHSDGMLAAARKRLTAAGIASRVTLLRGDAERLDLPDAHFDVVVSMFALIHFPDPFAALREMRRVLKPRGRLALSVGGSPPWSPRGVAQRLTRAPEVLALARGRLLLATRFLDGLVDRHGLPDVGPALTEYARHHTNRTAGTVELVKRAGFRQVRRSFRTHAVDFDSIQDFWDVQRLFSSSARRRIQAADPGAVARLRADFDARCRRVLDAGGRLRYPTAALYVTAVR